MLDKKIKEVMSSQKKFLEEIKRNGFDILKKYKIVEYEKENNMIKSIYFELKNNPLNKIWEWNGCIILLVDFIGDKMEYQVQCEARTDLINFPNSISYDEMKHRRKEFKLPNFKNKEVDWDGETLESYCNFSKDFESKSYKTVKGFKAITKDIIESDKNIEECIKTQREINEFELEYYNLEISEYYDKPFEDLTDEEIEEYDSWVSGMATYHMMVREGWIDED